MEWTDIRLTVAKSDADNAEAVATMIAGGNPFRFYKKEAAFQNAPPFY